MNVEIKSPTRIELTPETELEDNIVSGFQWKAEIVDPKPLQLNRRKVVLTRVEKKAAK